MTATTEAISAHEPIDIRPELTARQQQCLDFIRRHIAEHGFPPTLREIGAHMGIRSTNGVVDHLRALERKGHIKRSALASRGICATGSPEQAVPIWREENVRLVNLLARAERSLSQVYRTPEIVVLLGDIREALGRRPA